MVSILQKLRLSTPKVDAVQTDRCVFVKTSQGGGWSTNKGVGGVGKGWRGMGWGIEQTGICLKL